MNRSPATIQLKRIYDDPTPDDGDRVLVDRLWPRGISKEDARLDEWCKELAPSDELRNWFDHDPDKWQEFQSRYREELDRQRNRCHKLLDSCDKDTLTLLYAAKDEQHNNAVVLRDFLESLRSS
jgi:uncharacterized protein YeaO (DUF488 family)